MTRKQLMVKVMMTYGDKLTLGEIANIKAALKWYGEDDIDDIYWDEQITGIVEMYNYCIQGIKDIKETYKI